MTYTLAFFIPAAWFVIYVGATALFDWADGDSMEVRSLYASASTDEGEKGKPK